MAHYVIGEGWFKGDKLVGVTVHDITPPEAPDYHLAEAYKVELTELVHMLKTGHTLGASFQTAEGEKSFPVILARDEHGREAAMVKPDGYTLSLSDLKHAP